MSDKAINSFADAIAAAEAEISGDAEIVEEAPSTPPNDVETPSDDADVEAVEQPESVTTDEEEDLFDFGDEATDDVTSQSDQVPEALEIEGFGKLTPKEIRDGLLRQADYTQKTQQVAEERRQLELEREAFAKQQSSQAELWNSLKDSPKETVAWLATQVGLLDANDAKTKLNKIEGVRLADEASVQAEVQQRLEQAVMQHPAVQEALRERAVGRINAQFDQIADRVGKPLSDKAKERLMEFAYENGIADLVVAYDALSARAGQKKTDQKRSNSSQSRKAQNVVTDTAKVKVDSFEDAAKAALAELQASGVVS